MNPDKNSNIVIFQLYEFEETLGLPYTFKGTKKNRCQFWRLWGILEVSVAKLETSSPVWWIFMIATKLEEC